MATQHAYNQRDDDTGVLNLDEIGLKSNNDIKNFKEEKRTIVRKTVR